MSLSIHPEIRKLCSKPSPWMNVPVKGIDDIVISTRFRMARNVSGFPFPINCQPDSRFKVAGLIQEAIRRISGKRPWLLLSMDLLSSRDADLLFERKYISRQFASRQSGTVLALSPDRKTAVMIHEEDHLRIQYYLPGLQLEAAWKKLSAITHNLEKELAFAKLDDGLYAASRPDFCGTGLRVSVMIFIPALHIQKKIDTITLALKDMGMDIRGYYGEGADFSAGFYQISARGLPGETEKDTVERTESVIRTIVRHEENARLEQVEKHLTETVDFCSRSFGILKYSYRHSFESAFNMLSAIRFGLDLGLFSSFSWSGLNKVMTMIQPAHLSMEADRELVNEDAQLLRAEKIRELLNGPGSLQQGETAGV